MVPGIIFIAVVAIAIFAVLFLRKTRRQPSPCPFGLRIALQNPYIKAVAGEKVLIDRLDVRPGMQVLDVGCGFGRMSLPIATRVLPEGGVVAVDAQESMLKLLASRAEQQHIENIKTIQKRAGCGEFDWDGRYDRAMLVTVLGEIPDKEKSMREIHAALKPNGMLSITEVIPDPHYQSAVAVRRYAEAAGFRLIRKYGNFFAFTINFAKI